MRVLAIPQRMTSLAAALRQLRGGRRLLAAFALGSVMALTMPPFNAFPLLWLCLPALILLLQGTTSGKQAFVVGWTFAFGFFIFGLYWIAASMFVDIARFWWAVPFSVAGLPALLAVFYALAAVIARRMGLNGLRGAVLFGCLWFLADEARGHLLTGFPWNLLGYTWSGALPVLQVTSVIGIYGLTFLTAVAAALPAAFFTAHGNKKSLIAVAASIALFAGIGIWGSVRLQTTAVEPTPNVYVRLVQPNIAQSQKWLNAARESAFDDLIALSATPSERAVTHIFWPETASTYYLAEDAMRRRQIAAKIPAAAAVVTGVIRREADGDGKTHFYNSLVALDGLGRLVAGYDKAHLVPFGEYMPFRNVVGLRALAASEADFSRGPGPRSLRVLGLPPFSPLICYEAIFPDRVADPKDRPAFMVNLTNDGWYGKTTGPYQHFAIARVRAIEEGLPLLRIANTGISGVIDPLGRIEKQMNLGKRGVIDSDLPKPLPLTLFAKWRETLVWSVFFALVLILNAGLRKTARMK